MAGTMLVPSLHRAYLPSCGVNIFYREQSPGPAAKTILLLHGFPSSSHQFRKLMPLLAQEYRVIAPDLPGFGFSEAPEGFKFTFAALAEVMLEFVDALELSRFSMYIFDYGAPVGLRLACKRPELVESIITQNGNAYVEGFGDVWGPIKDFWASDNTQQDRDRLAKEMLNLETTKFQYVNGTADVNRVAPESYTLDFALLQRPGNRDIQLDLFMDYQHNITLYGHFQQYLRSSQMPLLAIWGKHDVFFVPAGADAFKKDLPSAQIKMLDAGHFASETHAPEIAEEVIQFLRQ